MATGPRKSVVGKKLEETGGPSKAVQQANKKLQEQAGPSKSPQRPTAKFQDTASLNTANSNEIIETYIIIPPDGGWGWVVAATSFVSNFTADGTMYTFGIFLDDVSKAVGCTPTDVAVANSLMTGFYYLSGPVISALTNRFGYRAVSMLGGLISGLSIFVTSYASQLLTILLVYGVLGGIGFGMMYVPSIVVIGFYFERWRAIATSIAVCGSSLGIIAFPVVFKGLLADLDWRTKFRILSVMCLLVAILSTLYRPLHPVRVVTGHDRNVSMRRDSPVVMDEETGKLSRFHNLGYPTAADVHGQSSTITIVGARRSSSLSIFIGTTTPAGARNFNQLRTVFEDEQDEVGYAKKRCCAACRSCCLGTEKKEMPTRPLYRDDIFYSGSLVMLHEYVPDNRVAGRGSLDYLLSVTRGATLKDLEEDNGGLLCCPISIKRTLVTMLDMSLLKSPSFLLLCFSGLFTTLGLYTPFLFIAERAKQNGMEESLAYYLISTLGISNTIGRIACGIFSSLPNIKALFYSTLSLTICGLATLASSLSYEKAWQFGFATMFGLTVACIAALRPVIIAEMVGIDNLTNGFGLCLLFQGIACLIGLPLSGLLRTLTGDYDMSFYFTGTVILLSAFLLMPLEAVQRWEHRREANRE